MSPELQLGQIFTAPEGLDERSVSQLLNDTPKNPIEFNELLSSFLNQNELITDRGIPHQAPVTLKVPESVSPDVAEFNRQALATEKLIALESRVTDATLEVSNVALNELTEAQMTPKMHMNTQKAVYDSVTLNEVQDDEAIAEGVNIIAKADSYFTDQKEPQQTANQAPTLAYEVATPVSKIFQGNTDVDGNTEDTKIEWPIRIPQPLVSSPTAIAPTENEITLTKADKTQDYLALAKTESIMLENGEQVLPNSQERIDDNMVETGTSKVIEELPVEPKNKESKEVVFELKTHVNESKAEIESKPLSNPFSDTPQHKQKRYESTQVSEVKVNGTSSVQQTSIETPTKLVNNKPLVESLNEQLGTERWKEGFSDKIRWFAINGIKQATVQINPRELGPISVKLEALDAQLNLHFVVANESVKTAVDAAQAQIRELLQQNGFNLENFTSRESSKEHTKEGSHFTNQYHSKEEMNPEPLLEQRVDASQGIVNLYI